MASVDDGRYSQEASDEAFTHECGPCNSESKTKEPNHYCTTCSEYICADCVGLHRKFKEMRDHAIVSGLEVSKQGPNKPTTVPGVKCDCSQNFVEFLCEDHNEVVCGACHTVKHRKCTTVLIQNKCSMAMGYQHGSVLKKVKSLENEIDVLMYTAEEEKRCVNRMTDAGSAEIKHFRNKLDIVLDTKEQKLMKDINALGSEQNKTINQHVSSLATTLQMLQADRKTLENLESHGSTEAIFATEIKVSKPLIEYETVMLDIEKEFKKCSIMFEPNMLLEASMKDVSFGSLKINEAKLQTKDQPPTADTIDTTNHVTSGKHYDISSQAAVEISDDGERPDITGWAVWPNENESFC